MKRVEGIKVGEYSISLRTQELRRLYQLEEIRDLISDLATICESRKVLVLVDELDRGWDASDNARQFVAGLFRAAISVNSLTPNLRVLISLRRELYDNIPEIYEDSQKVRDLIRYVEWDTVGLKQLIEKRIWAARIKYQRLRDWYTLFPKMIGEPAQDSFDYFVNRTLFRPRELIQFCNQCLEMAPADAETVDYNTIRRAEIIYSRDRAQDIAAEYRFQYPGLAEIFETFRGMPCVIAREDLEFHCLQILEGETLCPKTESWIHLKDHEELIYILWQIGFVRAFVENAQKSGTLASSLFLGSHQVATVNLNNVSQFMIHEMFWSYYGVLSEQSPM